MFHGNGYSSQETEILLGTKRKLELTRDLRKCAHSFKNLRKILTLRTLPLMPKWYSYVILLYLC